MLTKHMEKKLDGNCTRMLQAILNKSCKQHSTKQLYGHSPPISKAVQIRQTRLTGYCWRYKDKIISDVLQWSPSHRCASVGQLIRTYLPQLYADTGCNLEDMPGAIDDKDKWKERVREIHSSSKTMILNV